jgi:Ni/Fe-hydrogenase subunit HybB-like protein
MSFEAGSPECASRVKQLDRLHVRAELLLRALRIFYASLGSFAAAAPISVVGSALAFYGQREAFQAAAILGLVIGAFAVTALVGGCMLMVRETRLAVQNLVEEEELARAWRQRHDSPPVA